MKESNLYIGTLSGTSADSIDAALFDLGKKIKVIGSLSKKIPQNLKSKIIKFSNSKRNLYERPTKELIDLDNHFAMETSNLINQLISKLKIDKDLINFNLLTISEKNYLFKYHMEIYFKISKYLNQNEKKWLADLI